MGWILCPDLILWTMLIFIDGIETTKILLYLIFIMSFDDVKLAFVSFIACASFVKTQNDNVNTQRH